MTRKLVVDSSCDITNMQQIEFARVPFDIRVDDQTVTDNPSLDVSNLVSNFEAAKSSGSACPSPGAWYEAAGNADEVFMLPISQNISGSYNAAMVAKSMLEAEGRRVHVADTQQAGPGIDLIALRAQTLLILNEPFERIARVLDTYQCRLTSALKSVDNFIKAGRAPGIVGSIFKAMKLSAICEASEGKFKLVAKKRGDKQIISAFLEDMRRHNYRSGDVVISHCLNPELADQLAHAIQSVFHTAPVTVLPSSGLCAYYAERGGVMLGYAT